MKNKLDSLLYCANNKDLVPFSNPIGQIINFSWYSVGSTSSSIYVLTGTHCHLAIKTLLHKTGSAMNSRFGMNL